MRARVAAGRNHAHDGLPCKGSFAGVHVTHTMAARGGGRLVGRGGVARGGSSAWTKGPPASASVPIVAAAESARKGRAVVLFKPGDLRLHDHEPLLRAHSEHSEVAHVFVVGACSGRARALRVRRR